MLGFLLGAVALWLAWRLTRSLTSKSPLARVPGPPSSSLIGNVFEAFGEHSWGFHEALAEKYGGVCRLKGPLGSDWLYVFDPVAMYSIILQDQDAFDQVAWLSQSNMMLLGPGLLAVGGAVHRRQRKMLTPAFSAKHLREMTPVFYGVTDKLVTAISTRVADAKGTAEVDVMTWMGRVALELIGQAGIGHSFDPLTEDTTDDYTIAAKTYLSLATTPLAMALRQLHPLWHLVPPWLGHRLVSLMPSKNVRELQRVTDTLWAKSSAIFAAKKAAQLRGDLSDSGKDIMSIMLRANLEATEDDRLPDDQLVAQMSTLLFAAVDTTSNALAHTLQLLSEHSAAQDRLRAELRTASDAAGGARLSYDELHRLPFLDAVCRETLRLHAPVPTDFRAAIRDTVLPLSRPIPAADDGAPLPELAVPRGTNVLVSIWNANRDRALWGPDAGEWVPERWLRPLPRAVEDAPRAGIYSHLMTFFGGSHSCIGFKFSQLEMKLVLSELVQNFSFEPQPEREIVWNVSGVSYPSTSRDSRKPELYLKVRKVESR